MTHTVKNQDWEPPRNFEKNYAKKESDRIELLNEVRRWDPKYYYYYYNYIFKIFRLIK